MTALVLALSTVTGEALVFGAMKRLGLGGDDAVFVDQTVPSVMATRETAQVRIAMKNTGTTSWKTDSETFTTYFLGSQNPPGNDRWGLSSVPLPTEPINPHQVVEYLFSITAPETPGLYDFQWQMVRERLGVRYAFGQPTPNVQIQVQAADEAVVTGRVTDKSGQPVKRARVLIEVVGSFISTPDTQQRREDYSPRALWGVRQVVQTDLRGRYDATIKVPEFIPSQHRYARIVVAKPVVDLKRHVNSAGAPAYGMQSKLVNLEKPLTTYTADFVLERIAYGAFVFGSVRDAVTGQRLPASNVAFEPESRIWTVDTDGEFFGVIPLSGPTQTRRVWVLADTTHVGEGLWNDRAINGIAYERFVQEITFAAGKRYRLDVMLDRKPIQTAIFGQLTDRMTGKPIPNALVNLSQVGGVFDCTVDPRKCIWFTTFVVTDPFGRYLLPVTTEYPPLVQLWYLKVSTNGAFLPYTDASPPYQLREIDLGGKVQPGDVYQLDFSLVPN